MDIIKEFIETYGVSILYTILTAIAGYIGIAMKNLYNKYVNDKTKKNVVRTCVRAVEQIYKDLHGEEKLNMCIESVSEMLCEKGITISELEIRMLIEAAVNEMNAKIKDVFNSDNDNNETNNEEE